MKNPSYKNENIEKKYFSNMRKNKFLKIKNSLLNLKLKDRELKDREVKISRDIEELYFKPIIVSIDNMDKFEQEEMKKIGPIRNAWYD